jgi:hypothetical protein
MTLVSAKCSASSLQVPSESVSTRQCSRSPPAEFQGLITQ